MMKAEQTVPPDSNPAPSVGNRHKRTLIEAVMGKQDNFDRTFPPNKAVGKDGRTLDERKKAVVEQIPVTKDQGKPKQKKPPYISSTSYSPSRKHSNSTNSGAPMKGMNAGKPRNPKEMGATTLDRRKNVAIDNKKLYKELDGMLAGAKGFEYHETGDGTNRKKRSHSPMKPPANTPAILATQTPGRGIQLQPHPDKAASKPQPTEVLAKSGTAMWRNSEQKALALLKNLDSIDNFEYGDFTPKSKEKEVKVSSRTEGDTQHIIADIPIQMPSPGRHAQTARTTINATIDATGKIPIISSAEVDPNGSGNVSTFRQGVDGKVSVVSSVNYSSANVRPADQAANMVNLSTDTHIDHLPLDTYRQHGNPISERLLREKAERERHRMERQSLKYFDTSDMPLNVRDSEDVPGPTLISKDTIVSDPGPPRHHHAFNEIDHLKYSPEGFLADKMHRKAKKQHGHSHRYMADHGAYADRRTDVNRNSWDNEINIYSGRSNRERRYVNHYQAAAQSARNPVSSKEIYGERNYDIEQEDTVIRQHLEQSVKNDLARYRGQQDMRYNSWEIARQTHDTGRNRYFSDSGALKTRDGYSDRNTGYANKNRDENAGTVNYQDSVNRNNENADRNPNNRGISPHENAVIVAEAHTTYRDKGPYNDLENGIDKGSTNRDTYSDNSRLNEKYVDHATVKYENKHSYQNQNEIYTGRENAKKPEASLSKDDGEKHSNLSSRQGSGGKVQYVIRRRSSGVRKAGSSKTASAKSQRSLGKPQPSFRRETSEQTPQQPSREVSKLRTREKSLKMEKPESGSFARTDKSRLLQQESESQIHVNNFPRQSPIGSEHNRQYSEDVKQREASGDIKPKTKLMETVAKLENDVANALNDDLTKYFDDPQRPESKSSKIPFYSDTLPKYSKQKSEVESAKDLVFDESNDKRMSTPTPRNKIDASSDWNEYLPLTEQRQTDHKETPESPEAKIMKSETPRYVAKGKEKTMDSQGPTQDERQEMESSLKHEIKQRMEEKMKSEPHHATEPTHETEGLNEHDKLDQDIDLDAIQTGMEQKDIYVCYLLTDDGEKIGPMRLDIQDIQIGLPGQEKDLPAQEKEDSDEDKQEPADTEGMKNRQTGSHGLNEFSSRSHSMLMLTIDSEQQDPEDENLFITKRGKLTFVDLAGSEKVKDSMSTAETLVESNNINKSLLILGNCISSLGDPKRRQGHIPYRDSKLTKLLADSLGGNGVTLMICCITPSSHHAFETMNTLRYASRAKKIRTKPVIKMDPREKLILSLKREIKVLRNENHYLREQLDFPAKPRGELQKENDQKFMKLMKETNGKPSQPNATVDPSPEKIVQNGAKDESGLYEMLQEYMVENETLRTDNSEMQIGRDKIRQEQQMLYRDNEKLMKRVDELERRIGQSQHSWQNMPRQGSQPDHMRSRNHSPHGSPQYIRAGPGNGNVGPPANRLPPPADLPLRDPGFSGPAPQGYSSPTGSGKGKQPANRGLPMKPPHRLPETMPQQNMQNGGYMNGHPPPNHPAQMRQHPGSPNRANLQNDNHMDSRRSSQSTSSDAIRDMNEKLKQELMQLEGEIHHHHALNQRNSIYGSQGSIR